MRRLILVMMFFIPAIAAAEPSLVFETEKHDFGTVLQSAGQLEYVFTLTNTGTDMLIIEQVNTS